MEEVVVDRRLQMNRHEQLLAKNNAYYPSFTYYLKTLWNLIPIGLIIFIMVFSASAYYLFTTVLSGFFNIF